MGWAFFLGCCSIFLTYCPGSHHAKPSALFHVFWPNPSTTDPEPVISPSCIVEAASWQVEERFLNWSLILLDQKSWTGGMPLSSPASLASFGPCSSFSKASVGPPLTMIPGLSSPLHVGASGKSSHQTFAGLLNRFQIFLHPWSHVALDFVRCVLIQRGKYQYHVENEDRPCFHVYFIPLTKLPFTVETWNLLVGCVFCLHSFLRYIVTDRGPTSPFRLTELSMAIA